MPTYTDRMAGNYLSQPVKTLNDYQWDARIDHNMSDNDRLFGRFSWENAEQYLPTGLPDFGATGGFSSNQTFKTRARNIALSYTHVFQNNTINQFTAGYNRVFNYITSFGYLSNKSKELGIPGANLGAGNLVADPHDLPELRGRRRPRASPRSRVAPTSYHYNDTLTAGQRIAHAERRRSTVRFMQLNLLGDTALAGQFAFTACSPPASTPPAR